MKKVYFLLMVLLMTSAVVGRAFSAFNSIVIILLTVTWLYEGGFPEKFRRLFKEPALIALLLLFVLFVISIFHSQDRSKALFIAQRELPILILPTVLLSKRRFSEIEIRQIFLCYVVAAFVWMSVATLIAFIKYFQQGDLLVFFYHGLVKPVGSTAIYASMTCILPLILVDFLGINRNMKWLLYLLFTIWLMLLSSRMFLTIYGLLFLVFIFHHISRRYRLWILVTGAVLLFTLCFNLTPIKKRFADFDKFKLEYLKDKKFSTDIYFDGLSLRLIYIRFSLEIMKEHSQYLWGVGTGDAENLLKEKIRQYGMNTGDGKRKDGGYLLYSFHNVYLETFVGLGLLGLGCLLFFFGYIGFLGVKYKSWILLGLFIIVCFSAGSDVIVLNSQSDLSAILSILCLCIMSFRSWASQKDIQTLVFAN